ncbi:M-like protein [Deinococcus wulumuqiensis]|uniref:M-like protein n=1 Tax=Deinococcus wulumuqiensis TaxID=980427 RepID=A0A345IGS9_9DEIO|nr:M-like protein [Deinococcus wulumuqiensis]AXG98901.1 M-like protein [Deinococcus wulumuqiensis]
MNDNGNKPVKTEDEISNVDLQFMGETDEKRELNAAVKAESKAAAMADKEGVDKIDVMSAQSMDASDPPSTNMGDAERDDSDNKDSVG